MHRADPFPGCFGGPGQTHRPGQPRQPGRSSTLANKQRPALLGKLQCGYGPRGRGQRETPGPCRALPDPCRPRGRPLPAVVREESSGAVLASCRGLASPVYRWVFVLALRRFPAPGSTARGPTGPVRAEGGKKIANRASLRSGPRGAPALFSAPGGRSTFCTISAYRRFFVRSLLSLCMATLLPAASRLGGMRGTTDRMTSGPLLLVS